MLGWSLECVGEELRVYWAGYWSVCWEGGECVGRGRFESVCVGVGLSVLGRE